MKLKLPQSFLTSQNLIISFVWLLLFANPILIDNFSRSTDWNQVFSMWREYLFVFIIFIINRLFLTPHLFFKGKRVFYFISIIAIIVINAFVAYLVLPKYHTQKPLNHHFTHRPHDFSENERRADRFPPPAREKPPAPPFGNLVILVILLLGFDIGLSFQMKLIESNRNKIIIEKEGVKNKMAFLQNQISPHFFMNTLNNIHALIDISSEVAQDAIIKLSEMMSYMLYESQTETISLSKEIEFIKSYVELMRIRFTDDIDIVLNISDLLPDAKIPPLLTISFIENAFIHGVSYDTKSFIHIYFNIEEHFLTFKVLNSINIREKSLHQGSGIGLENIKNRLNLIYGDNYELGINRLYNDIFEVSMRVPL